MTLLEKIESLLVPDISSENLRQYNKLQKILKHQKDYLQDLRTARGVTEENIHKHIPRSFIRSIIEDDMEKLSPFDLKKFCDRNYGAGLKTFIWILDLEGLETARQKYRDSVHAHRPSPNDIKFRYGIPYTICLLCKCEIKASMWTKSEESRKDAIAEAKAFKRP